jgi:paraquat-inducible protein A
MLALILTTFIVFVIANVFPVISVSFQGVRNSITLWQASLSLAHWPLLPLALVTLWSLLIVPLLQIVLLGWVMVFACKGRAAPGFIIAMKTLNWLRPWSWVEVAMLAFLIAGIKLSGPLDVITGPGSWAMLAFMMLIIPITHKDIQSLWMYVSIRIPDND